MLTWCARFTALVLKDLQYSTALSLLLLGLIPQTFFLFAIHICFVSVLFFIFLFFFLLALSFKDDTSTQQIGREAMEVLLIFWISEIERDLDQSEGFFDTLCKRRPVLQMLFPWPGDDHQKYLFLLFLLELFSVWARLNCQWDRNSLYWRGCSGFLACLFSFHKGV